MSDNESDNNMSNKSPRSDDGYIGHYEPNYAYQESNGHDNYGNPTYTTYSQRYSNQAPPGRDKNGFPTYNPSR